LGGALLPRRQPGHLLHDDLDPALDVGDVGPQLIGLAQGQRVFVLDRAVLCGDAAQGRGCLIQRCTTVTAVPSAITNPVTDRS
jgi:hypothetical protein